MKNNLVWKHLQPLLKNGWIGASVENQQTADERIPLLLQTPAPGRFLSVEPLLGPVDLTRWLILGWCQNCHSRCFIFYGTCGGCAAPAWPLISWVIIGGESGHGSRPCRVEWIRDLVQQCKAAGVPVFVKQIGSNPHELVNINGVTGSWPLNAANRHERIDGGNFRVPLRDRKGGDMDEWPEDLRVREFPTTQRSA